MSEYEQVPAAGNVDTQNAFRVVFSGADHSDIPQLQAWNDFNLNTISIESLSGTPNNANRSMVAAKSTHAGAAGAAWATGLLATAGGAISNRLKGNESFVLLGTAAPVAPFPVNRTFNLALLVPADASVGSIGMQPVLAVKSFYAGVAPVVSFQYNAGSDGSPNWKSLVPSQKGVASPIGVGNCIHFTGPDTVAGTGTGTGVLDAITKPGSGEKAAEETWIRTV